MPRYPRLFIPDVPLHVVQRGHDRKPVFVQHSDYQYYLDNLREVKAELEIRLVAYCLMTNHVHLVLVPGKEADAVSDLMRVLAARQTRRINKLENRSGTLWEGRFKASLIDTSDYLLACCRYVDLNPVRASVVSAPEDYDWSGYRSRCGLADTSILDEHHVFRMLGGSPADRGTTYRRYVSEGVGDAELALIRQAVQRNQLTGDSRFKADIEARIGRRLSTKARGRPRKHDRK